MLLRKIFNIGCKTLLAKNGLTYSHQAAKQVNIYNLGMMVQSRGMKRHVAVHRRCPDCKITRPRGRLMVLCETHARHNQMQFGRRGQERLHKPYPWRWPDPFDKKYSLGRFHGDRYLKAFSKD